MMFTNAMRLAAVVGMLMVTADVQAGGRFARRGHGGSGCGSHASSSCYGGGMHGASSCYGGQSHGMASYYGGQSHGEGSCYGGEMQGAGSCYGGEMHAAAPCCTADVSAPHAATYGSDANAPPVAPMPGTRQSFSIEPSAGLPMTTEQPFMTSVPNYSAPNYSAPSYSSRSRDAARSSHPSYLMQKSDFHRYSTR